MSLQPPPPRASSSTSSISTLRHRHALSSDSSSPNKERPKGRLANLVHERVERYQQRMNRIGEQLPPQIERRHISVISIGGVIGTGLFIGTATALHHAGPAGTLIGFAITGTVVWSVVVSIGEIVAFLPNVGGPIGLADLYVDPALAFSLGWNAWYNWTIILPTELSAAALLINGFFSNSDGTPSRSLDFMRNAELVSISILLVIAIAVNAFGSRAYGEVEFVFSCIKILTIIILIFLGIALDAGAGAKGKIGFSNWKEPFRAYRVDEDHPSAFGKFLGLWSVTNQAVFAFFGTEVPGIAAGEVRNPVRNIPHAIKGVWIRIVLFYIIAVFIAGLIVDSNDDRLHNKSTNKVFTSPFIIALQDSGWPHVYKAANAAFVLSAFSAATSDVYISSRLLYLLGITGHAPAFCGATYRTEKTVVPIAGMVSAIAFGLLAFMVTTGAESVFRWLSAMQATTALLAWAGMVFTYLRWYRGTQLEEQRDPTFREKHWEDIYKNRSRFQPWVGIYAFVMCIIIIIFNGWYVFTKRSWTIALEPNETSLDVDPEFGPWVATFITSYMPIPLFFFLFVGYKLIYRTQMVSYDEMPFMRGTVVEPEIEPPPKGLWQKFLAALF